jgi:hypothetical protein
VTFKDAKLLQPGHSVVYRGIVVGEVADVELVAGGGVRVTVEAYGRHAASLYKEAGFRIEATSSSVGGVEGRRIVVYDRGEIQTAIKGGEVIEGTESEVGSWFDSLSATGKTLWEKMAGEASERWDSIQQYFAKPEGEKFLKDVKEYAEKARVLGEEQFGAFKEEALPGLEQQASRLKQRLEAEGRVEEAKQFWKEFSKWMLEQQQGEAPALPPRE